jgi:hypothetical protein
MQSGQPYIKEENAMIETDLGKFPTGRIVITPAALEKLPIHDVLRGLDRHMSGDWGEVQKDSWLENEVALTCGYRLMSRYLTQEHAAFWIITEHDRSVTTILLPEEY